jgi:hypothetical protein
MEGSTASITGVTAEKYVVHPHSRAASKPRQEGFIGKHEETTNLTVSSSEYTSGIPAMHTENKSRAARKEKQTWVRNIDNLLIHSLLLRKFQYQLNSLKEGVLKERHHFCKFMYCL